MLAKMSSAVLVQTDRVGAAFIWSMVLPMAASGLAVVRDASRCRRRRVGSANQHSMRLSHEADVGMKCRLPARALEQPAVDQARLVGGRGVEHAVHVEVLGTAALTWSGNARNFVER